MTSIEVKEVVEHPIKLRGTLNIYDKTLSRDSMNICYIFDL